MCELRDYQTQLFLELSPHEKQAAFLVSKGYSNDQISEELNIQKKTVTQYILKCADKLDIPKECATRVMLARFIWELDDAFL